ncbi:uncharacterized protein LOC111612602 [Centruroides sculpturatus]|uniref:uncharacterized protein LOC111612602 n=1 Tax=Centruroides sculpturatus TaxID=218467 RepID=UPI000C6C9232|nr:uncharacterized protein LOC111612602 [Centruroides sculpturatus]
MHLKNSNFYRRELILCGYNLKNNIHIIEIWSRSLKNAPFRCRYCNRTFDTREELRKHMRDVHANPGNETRSGKSLKHEEFRTYREFFILYQDIILHDLFFEKIFATFTKLQTDFENSKRLSSQKKTEEYFKAVPKVIDNNDMKVAGPEKKKRTLKQMKSQIQQKAVMNSFRTV